MTAIVGNTYPVREKIKQLGGKWDAERKAWMVPDGRASEARSLVEHAPAEQRTPGKCAKCGRSCKPQYTLCYGCAQNARGKCAKCGDELDDWKKRHAIRLCLECRDGGSRAHGGQSYYDRSGNFVLGDDD